MNIYESQFGLMHGTSTTKKICILSQVMEKYYRAEQKSIQIICLDLEKDYEVFQETLSQLLVTHV